MMFQKYSPILLLLLTSILLINGENSTSGIDADFASLQADVREFNKSSMTPFCEALEEDKNLKHNAYIFGRGMTTVYVPLLYEDFNGVDKLIMLAYCKTYFEADSEFIKNEIAPHVGSEAKNMIPAILSKMQAFQNRCMGLFFLYGGKQLIQPLLNFVHLDGLTNTVIGTAEGPLFKLMDVGSQIFDALG